VAPPNPKPTGGTSRARTDTDVAGAAEEKLGEYRRKRNFASTPEPAGGPDAGEQAAAPSARFVVQEHHATALHWDLRLERDGVLPSWAVPKGIPPDPRVDHLAVQTEDHPLEYLEFHGEIPEGGYGAGTMKVWDTGTYETEKWSDREVMVVFHGERVEGRYVLFRTRGKDWMIHRMDPPADPTRELIPASVEPMLASSATELPGGGRDGDADMWAYEVLWQGQRAVIPVDGGRLSSDLTARFPELRALGLSMGSLTAVLDGVIVTFGADGRPDRQRLERRVGATSDATARRLAKSTPAVFVIFDVVWMEGHSVTGLPWDDRRQLLEDMQLAGPSWQVPAAHRGAGAALLAAVTEQGLAGVVAKRRSSVYSPGTTSEDWLAVRAPSRPS
jgi:bifunctional non-homologous end joining protein LigD